MKAEYINPFLMECGNMFKEVAEMNLTLKGTCVKNSPVTTKNVVIMLGITGDLRGSVSINLDREFAMKIASNMIGGMPVTELNEISKSAVQELGNMIMGRVCTNFSNKGLSVDITPPSMMTGDNLELSVASVPLLSIKFQWDNYDLDLDISISEK